MNTKTQERTYLGDGLYAEYDGLMFTLIAPRDDGDHFVCLEPEVMDSFLAFAGKKWGGKFTFTQATR